MDVLITGAARGIGAETARRLAARGHRLALLGLEGELLEQVARESGDAWWREVDVTDREALAAAVEDAASALGGFDAVVANAGIAAAGPARSMDPAAWERVIDVNLLGVYRTVRAALPYVIARRGYVLPVASMIAIFHSPMLTAYAASKAGVEAFANSLRAELGHHGVDVGCAYFSWIDTEIVRGADRRGSLAGMRAQMRGPFARTHPVANAADAMVWGIERRARAVAYPGWLRWPLLVRGLFTRLVEHEGRRSFPDAERQWEAEAAATGAAASAPVGAGGAADSR